MLPTTAHIASLQPGDHLWSRAEQQLHEAMRMNHSPCVAWGSDDPVWQRGDPAMAVEYAAAAAASVADSYDIAC
jgi:hypothetical protein